MKKKNGAKTRRGDVQKSRVLYQTFYNPPKKPLSSCRITRPSAFLRHFQLDTAEPWTVLDFWNID